MEKSVQNHNYCKSIANVIKYINNSLIYNNNKWLNFNEKNSKWGPILKDDVEKILINNNLIDIYDEYSIKYKKLRDINNEYEKSDEPVSKDYFVYDNYHTNCIKIILNLKKDTKFKNEIIECCKSVFYKEDFELDSNNNLIGLDNCVIDLKCKIGDKTEIMIRKKKPEDFIELSTGYKLPINDHDLPISFDEFKLRYLTCNDIYELDDFIHKILPIEDDREYTLRYLSSCLSGEIFDQKFHIWIGSGGNGKSVLLKLVQHTLGAYSMNKGSYLLESNKLKSNKLKEINNSRFISILEPHKSIIKDNLKKLIDSNKIMMMCNELPKISDLDSNIVRHIEVVEFPSKFVENPRPTMNNPYEYLIDKKLDSKIESWKILFLLKLLEYYKKFIEEGTKAPPSVTEYSEIYILEKGPIQYWIKKDLVECDEPKSLNTLHNTFNAWCDNKNINSRNFNKKEIKKTLEELQEKSQYGLQYGDKPSDNAQNGTSKYPKFNFCSKDDLDDFDN